MSLPVTIVFQDMTPSLRGCHVALRHNEGRQRQDNRYLAHVRVTLPGGELEAGRAAEPNHSYGMPKLPYATPSMRCVGSWKTSRASAMATSKPIIREVRVRQRVATFFSGTGRTIA